MQIRESPLNGLAGDYLQRARESLTPKRTRPEFAVELGQMLGIELASNTYWSWERGKRLVPAAAMVAAFRLSGLPMADPEGERTLAERLLRLEEGLEELRSELHARRDTRPLGSGAPRQGGFRP